MGEYHDLYLKSDVLLLADVFENFRKMCLKIFELDLVKFVSAPGLAWQAALKKTEEKKIELLAGVDMLLMIENGIRCGICYAIYRYAKANNKYMKDYDKNKESSYLNHWDANNLYGWAMYLKLPVNNFERIEETSQFNEDFIKNYNEESDEGYFFKVDVQYPNKLHELHNNLAFLSERTELGKVEKLVTNLDDKNENAVHIMKLKQALNHGLVLKEVHRVVKFNQKAWLKPYIKMNIGLRKIAKYDFEKDLFKFFNRAAFGKTKENVRKHRYIKLVTTERRRNLLSISEPNYHTRKVFTEHL